MLDLLELLQERYNQQDYAVITRAYEYSKDAHSGQKRASGEDYFTHPCAVAKILVDLGLDAATISAALLHDVIEDTPVSEGDIKKEFGEEVLELVVGVTKLEKITKVLIKCFNLKAVCVVSLSFIFFMKVTSKCLQTL